MEKKLISKINPLLYRNFLKNSVKNLTSLTKLNSLILLSLVKYEYMFLEIAILCYCNIFLSILC